MELLFVVGPPVWVDAVEDDFGVVIDGAEGIHDPKALVLSPVDPLPTSVECCIHQRTTRLQHIKRRYHMRHLLSCLYAVQRNHKLYCIVFKYLYIYK